MNCLKVCGTNCIWRTTRPLSLKSTNSKEPADTIADIPEEPTTCCMSGCANCVWLDYAEQLSKRFDDSGAKSRDIILSKITDPNMKAFLTMELRHIEKNKTTKGS